MATTGSELSKAIELQKSLEADAQRVRDLMTVPLMHRDPDAILSAWHRIDRERPRLSSLFRRLRNAPRLPRRGLSRSEYAAQKLRLNEVALLDRRLRIWNEISDLVARHANPTSVPLDLYRPENASDPILTMLHTALHRLANPNVQSDDADAYGCFPDIPLRIQLFEGLMLAAYRLLLVQGRADCARFLDVGCGGGTKVFAASRYFPVCHGLEYDQEYAAAGQRTLAILNVENCAVFHVDGLKFDDYGSYDVIYFYRPLQDDELLAKMEQKILRTARRGTIILAPYDLFLTPRSGFPAANITGPVFVAGLSQKEADLLRAEAEATSPELIRRARHLNFDVGFWRPILDGALVNGAH